MPDRLRRFRLLLPALALGFAALMFAPASRAASGPKVAPGFTIQKIATLPKSITSCDDIAYLDGHLFVACQNLTLSPGGGGDSTIVEFATNGAMLNTWSVVDKADGLGADPLHHRLIVTLDEDGHTHLATITPSAPAGQQVVNYNYNVAPDSHTLTGPLHTGGGTDSVSVDSAGDIYVSASYGIAKTGTAVFKVALTPPASAGGTGVAKLSPTFLDNATAANGNTGSGTVQLKLIDVDSNGIVPYTSQRYAGQFVIGDQTALELVFASNINAGTGLTVLKTPFGLDDIRWTTGTGGTLFVVDKGASTSSTKHGTYSYLYRITGPFVPGVAYASNDSIPDQVDIVNLKNGKLTPFVHGLNTAKGLVYVDASGNSPALPLAASATAQAPTPTVPAAPATPAAVVTETKSDSDALAIVLAIIALVLAVVGGGAGLMRGRSATSG